QAPDGGRKLAGLFDEPSDEADNAIPVLLEPSEKLLEPAAQVEAFDQTGPQFAEKEYPFVLQRRPEAEHALALLLHRAGEACIHPSQDALDAGRCIDGA